MHPQGVDYVDNLSPETDLNGHGTHVAGKTRRILNSTLKTHAPPSKGTVMSNTYGLAKKATSIAVRVLNAGGSGYLEVVPYCTASSST